VIVRRFLALVLLLAADIALAQRPVTFEKDSLVIETAAGRHRFSIELALTDDQMAQGLMFRRQMAPDAGMLFVYERPQTAAFWMRNTFIPLDMLFIGADGRIVNIAERTVPQTDTPVPSNGPVKAVLELNGGTCQRLGIKAGDRVRYKIFP
jgi:uncharacterized membrane protein (UPF0127 family)